MQNFADGFGYSYAVDHQTGRNFCLNSQDETGHSSYPRREVAFLHGIASKSRVHPDRRTQGELYYHGRAKEASGYRA